MPNKDLPPPSPKRLKKLRRIIGKQVAESDIILETILGTVFGENNDNVKNTFPITVLTSAGAVSGTAVAATRWWRSLSESITQSSEALGEAFQKSFDDYHKYMVQAASARVEHKIPHPPYRYLHLEDATVYTGSVPLHHGHWRIKIDHIDGWSLGTR